MDYLYTVRADRPAPEFKVALGILSGRIPLEPSSVPESESLKAHRAALAEREDY